MFAKRDGPERRLAAHQHMGTSREMGGGVPGKARNAYSARGAIRKQNMLYLQSFPRKGVSLGYAGKI